MWKDMTQVIDFHSHILPGVDDGAKDLEMSLQMLSLMAEQGVDKVVSSSHYYGNAESVEEFLTKRNEALFHLERYIKEHDLFTPEIIPAAEVRMYPDLSKEPMLDKLCIGESKNILVEMPYIKWHDWMYNELYMISLKGLNPVIAHIERYLDLVPLKHITEKLLSLDVFVQCNSDAFNERKERRFVKKLIKYGRVSAIGSDCHSTTARCPNMNISLEYISKKFGDDMIAYIMDKAAGLII